MLAEKSCKRIEKSRTAWNGGSIRPALPIKYTYLFRSFSLSLFIASRVSRVHLAVVTSLSRASAIFLMAQMENGVAFHRRINRVDER